ncbi:MAG TPA: hypothetical protein VLX11_17135 [Candidatus Acidoferrales bacterium]|nr:hypothetical protein [Candidatus Acidoferrales bacterium]
MNLAHIHLLLNHFPVIGILIGLGLFLGALIGNSNDLKKAGVIVFLGIALLSIPTYMSGNAAQQAIKGLPGISNTLMVKHQNAALLAYFFMEILGGVSWFGLWQFRRNSRFGSGTLVTILVLSLVTAMLMANAANIGGAIRHPEILSVSGTTGSAERVGLGIGLDAAVIGHFIAGGVRWAWATCQTLHFMGLSLLMGVVFVVDLRMFGIMKNVSFATVHRLLPWGMLGFGLNLFTGMCYFIAAPEQYTKNVTFYWKIALIMIAGANAIYFTVFDEPWAIREKENATLKMKLIAASALVLWIGVMFCGLMLPFIGNAF